MKLEIALGKLETLFPYVALLRRLDGQDSQFAETAKQEVEYLLRVVWTTPDPEFKGTYLDECGELIQGCLQACEGEEAYVLEVLTDLAWAEALRHEPKTMHQRQELDRYAFLVGFRAYCADSAVSFDEVRNHEVPEAWAIDKFPTVLDRSPLVKAWLEGWNCAQFMDNPPFPPEAVR